MIFSNTDGHKILAFLYEEFSHHPYQFKRPDGATYCPGVMLKRFIQDEKSGEIFFSITCGDKEYLHKIGEVLGAAGVITEIHVTNRSQEIYVHLEKQEDLRSLVSTFTPATADVTRYRQRIDRFLDGIGNHRSSQRPPGRQSKSAPGGDTPHGP